MDNVDNKPIKVEVKPAKGPSGKVNIKIYKANKSGSATIMISGGDLVHVKTLAFKIVKYILDGIIDGELTSQDIANFKQNPADRNTEGQRKCDICGKSFKTQHGLKIHNSKMHSNVLKGQIDMHKSQGFLEMKCKTCNFIFKEINVLEKHIESCGKEQPAKVFQENLQEKLQSFQCDYCDLVLIAESNLDGLQKLKSHHETCSCRPNISNVSEDFACD